MNKPTLLALSIASSLLLTACGGASINEQDTNNGLAADASVTATTENNLDDSPEVVARETQSALSKFFKVENNNLKLPSVNLPSIGNLLPGTTTPPAENTSAPITNTKAIDIASLVGSNSLDADLGQFIKSLTGESLKLPLDVQSSAKQISNDASENLCETGSATVLGQTDIDKAKFKGVASLNFRFDNCVTKTDGNELTGDIELLVKLGMQDTDIEIELKDLDIVKEGETSRVDV